jgi:hypothetical protein
MIEELAVEVDPLFASRTIGNQDSVSTVGYARRFYHLQSTPSDVVRRGQPIGCIVAEDVEETE